jgi:hypothetical protein
MERNVKRIFFSDEGKNFKNVPFYELEDGTILQPVFYMGRCIWITKAELDRRIQEGIEGAKEGSIFQRIKLKFLNWT